MLVHALSLLLLACAVSLDGFGAGVTYGLRKIRIPGVSVLIIACCSGCIIWLSMAAGTLITALIPASAVKLTGALLLALIGCWTLVQARRSASAEPEEHAGGSSGAGDEGAPPADGAASAAAAAGGTAVLSTVWRLELKRPRLVIQILRAPQAADVDRSGTISASEAVLLGCALSLDAFGAGLGAALLGFPPVPTALLIAAASGLLLRCGMSVGLRFAGWRGMRLLSALPGLILIVMGITRLL